MLRADDAIMSYLNMEMRIPTVDTELSGDYWGQAKNYKKKKKARGKIVSTSWYEVRYEGDNYGTNALILSRRVTHPCEMSYQNPIFPSNMFRIN